ncbi:hypothetical protein DUNSADRAFT_13414 [Dunaliella salina]|uniref:Encoded protein n=1 Tax=Dunaliella salina TaxID=3046 RepID=A0ABQ7H396_DUNSA|nr:hypothetical protein DUNSADRAFT_13414 [Dunaliella salina]|eukprot:KAF5841337.1 hypothetical protein DUNSADRAFT_13414 [Dunaliella salina]
MKYRYACPRGSQGNLRFCKGSPIFAVPMQRSSISRNLHVAATHPLHDTYTGEQSTILFALTGAKSLLIAGAHRHAYRKDSDCQPQYSLTDAAHNTDLLFHKASLRIHAWQQSNTSPSGGGGCQESCAFLQPHGKGRTTCPDDTVFVSAGTSTQEFYTDMTADNDIINTFVNELASGTGWAVRTPATSDCYLIGSTNVQGRIINQVQQGSECGTPALESDISGNFLHMESEFDARDFRDQGQMEALATALRAAITCSCAGNMSCVDGMCI